MNKKGDTPMNNRTDKTDKKYEVSQAEPARLEDAELEAVAGGLMPRSRELSWPGPGACCAP
jgi:hypothetical protein